jgi:sensor domain CHASE-containing protein
VSDIAVLVAMFVVVGCAVGFWQFLSRSRDERSSDESRWALVEEALNDKRLSDFSKLVAIRTIVDSRRPLSDEDIRRTMELFGDWEG